MTFKSYYIHCIFLSPRSTSAASLVQRDIKRGLEQKAGEDFKEQKLGYYVMPGIKVPKLWCRQKSGGVCDKSVSSWTTAKGLLWVIHKGILIHLWNFRLKGIFLVQVYDRKVIWKKQHNNTNSWNLNLKFLDMRCHVVEKKVANTVGCVDWWLVECYLIGLKPV